jgi:hypothetical protein
MFRKVRCILLLLSFLLVNKNFAQKNDFPSQEIKLIKLYSDILSYSQENYDSISYYAERFENELTNFIRNNPATLDYSFKNITDSFV